MFHHRVLFGVRLLRKFVGLLPQLLGQLPYTTITSEEKIECRYGLFACRKIREKTDGNIFRNIDFVYYPDRIDYHTWVQFIGRSYYRHAPPQQMICL